MRIPKRLETLVDDGIISDVLRPLMSGKEAEVYLVVSDEEIRAAKIYKDAQQRSFKNRADYVEGRRVRNSRDQRAMNKGTKYGKSRDEDAWKSTEVDMIYRLRDAGVRVPTPHTFIDGVLVMELLTDGCGSPAPRLGELEFAPDEAQEIFHYLLHQVKLMLCAGVVHGDLSEFNVLLADTGPVIIDFPQAVSAAGNRNARALLIRDVDNLQRYLCRWVSGARRKPYAEELWSLYESNRLTPETELRGTFKTASGPVDTREVLSLIQDANRDEARRRERPDAGTPAPATEAARLAPRRREVIVVQPPSRPGNRNSRGSGFSGSGPGGRRNDSGASNSLRGSAFGRGSSQGGRRDGRPSDSRSNDGWRGEKRSPDGRRGGPPGKRPAGSRPKRGDAVATSTYVSPEARKNKGAALKLTPREAAEAPESERSGVNFRRSSASDNGWRSHTSDGASKRQGHADGGRPNRTDTPSTNGRNNRRRRTRHRGGN